MNELFPILGGILLGALLVRVPGRARLWVGAAGVILIGFLATVISGEFRLTWGFLAIDIPLVALAATGSYLLLRRLRPRGVARTRPGA